ncbi:hypothetical protein E2C01_017851 [Portunus trituberculatus]|uniref:Uncharacterized protein n=1 Tax=Portunus trituberculatus TaxID=210409 RepID=A0A5B7DTK8_PORTR|nr:hypothetical protein [Portunus trituberculatus]
MSAPLVPLISVSVGRSPVTRNEAPVSVRSAALRWRGVAAAAAAAPAAHRASAPPGNPDSSRPPPVRRAIDFTRTSSRSQIKT